MTKLFVNLIPHSFRSQLIMGVGIMVSVLIITFIYFSTKQQGNFLYEQGIKQAINRSAALASSSKVWMLSNDYLGLEEVIESFSSYEDLLFISFINMEGKVLSHSDKTLVGKFIADTQRVNFLTKAIKNTGDTNVKLLIETLST